MICLSEKIGFIMLAGFFPVLHIQHDVCVLDEWLI